MLFTVMRTVEELRGLEQLMTPIARHFPEPPRHGIHLGLRHGLEAPRERDVLLQLGHRRDAHHLGRHR